MEKLVRMAMHGKVNEHKHQGLNKSQVARKLGIIA